MKKKVEGGQRWRRLRSKLRSKGSRENDDSERSNAVVVVVDVVMIYSKGRRYTLLMEEVLAKALVGTEH